MRGFWLGFSTLAAASLVGCASTATWQHPAKAGEGHDGATMALADCESYAAGRTPMPKLQGYMPVPAPTSYNTTGTYTNYGSYGSFQGTTTANSGFASGYASGANMGANIANAYALSAARDKEEKLTAACMRTLGWIDTSSPEGLAKFKQATSQLSQAKAAPEKSDSADKWKTEVQTFIEVEAARPGGIDYRKDKEAQELFDKYLKQIASDPKSNNQSGTWLLIESHKQVVSTMAQKKRWLDAFQVVTDLDSARPDRLDYENSSARWKQLDKHINAVMADPANQGQSEISITLQANKMLRKELGMAP